MNETINFTNEHFKFDMSISDRCYDHKPTSEDYRSMSFHVENLSTEEFTNRIKSGYSFCHIFRNNRRLKKNFVYAEAIFIDVDENPKQMETFVASCGLKPTIAYTTISDGKNGQNRFRLIYFFDEKITSEEEYKGLYNALIKEINLEQNKDNCGSVTAQMMNGNSSGNIRLYRSGLIYHKLYFLQKCQLEIYILSPSIQYISNRQFCKNREEGNSINEDDSQAIKDLKESVKDYL